jgi:hypothetical protein
MFRSYDHLHAEIYTYEINITLTLEVKLTFEINFQCVFFRLKMVVRPKHVVNNLNKIANNYINRVSLDGNP